MKTLVVVLCQTRAHELTFELFKKNVLDHLGADLCFCGEEPKDLATNPFIKEAKYTFMLKDEPEDSWDLLENAYQEITRDAGKSTIHWSMYLKMNHQTFMGGAKNKQSKSSFLLYYRWLLLKNLRETGALEKYDRFIITRSDYMWPFKHTSLDLLSPTHVWVPDGESYGGITDRHTVLSRYNVEEYLNIFNMMVIQAETYIPEILDIVTPLGVNPEKLISFHLSRQGIGIVKVFPYNMFTVRASDGSSSWSVGEYNQTLGYCIKYKSEFMNTVKFCYQMKKFNKTLRQEYYKFDPDDIGNLELENILKGIEPADDPTEYYNFILRNSPQ
jgi:hypothetical protein